jgi:hypothetical protein
VTEAFHQKFHDDLPNDTANLSAIRLSLFMVGIKHNIARLNH